MKNTLQLTIGVNDILGSDGIMKVDGRFNMESVKGKVKLRNLFFKENYPHKVADGFFLYNRQTRKKFNSF